MNPHSRLKIFALIVGLGLSLFAAGTSQADEISTARLIPILHDGRVQTLECFARETLTLITGRDHWQKENRIETLMGILKDPKAVSQKTFIRLDNLELLGVLGLNPEQKFFSYDELIPSMDAVESLVHESQAKRDQDLKPSMLEQASELLFTRIYAVKNLMNGQSIKVIPTEAQGNWTSPFGDKGLLAGHFTRLVDAFGKPGENFEAKASEWIEQIHKLSGDRYRRILSYELNYFDLRPFKWAWIAYLAGFVLLSLVGRAAPIRWIGTILVLTAFGFHTAGLVLRVLILERPPVSNMYESMVFMNWVLMLTAFVFAFLRKNLTVLSVASLVSAAVMIYGDLLPIDQGLDVLVPVLRSNYWLTIHVLTIVSSYGIFGLAMALGHRYLILDMFSKLSAAESEKSSSLIYRIIQLGILLLSIGTVLGGVWANESWGRFWGWDPKETWALITILGYLVIVHLKFFKHIGAYGLAMGSIIGFLLVLMTWYGVNFVLGRGLHSYGQGSGGMIWVIYYLAAETLFIALAAFRRVGRK